MLLLMLATLVQAHDRSESYSHWYPGEDDLTVVITIPTREVTRLPQVAGVRAPLEHLFLKYTGENIEVFRNGNECPATNLQILQSAPGFVRVELTWACEGGAVDTVQYNVMFDAAPSHIHYAKAHADNALIAEAILTDTNREWRINAEGPSESASFMVMVGLGLDHIISGYDHIAFVLGLLLIAGSLRSSVIAVTGFTIGHSISLAAAVLGYVSADGRIVEVMIGYTVALVAVDYFAIRRNDNQVFATGSLLVALLTGAIALRLEVISLTAAVAYAGFGLIAACYLLMSRRMAIENRTSTLLLGAAFGFGLVHGFGFAGFLMETGLLGTQLLQPLLAFNIGVELGQIAIVIVVLAAARLASDWLPSRLPEFTAAALAGLGTFWFLTRSLIA